MNGKTRPVLPGLKPFKNAGLELGDEGAQTAHRHFLVEGCRGLVGAAHPAMPVRSMPDRQLLRRRRGPPRTSMFDHALLFSRHLDRRAGASIVKYFTLAAWNAHS